MLRRTAGLTQPLLIAGLPSMSGSKLRCAARASLPHPLRFWMAATDAATATGTRENVLVPVLGCMCVLKFTRAAVRPGD
jgi:hypothetical protein